MHSPPDAGALADALRSTTLQRLLEQARAAAPAPRGPLLGFPENMPVLDCLRALQDAGVRSGPVVAGSCGGAGAGGGCFPLSAFRGFVEATAIAGDLIHGAVCC
jgi:hypothetical protein